MLIVVNFIDLLPLFFSVILPLSSKPVSEEVMLVNNQALSCSLDNLFIDSMHLLILIIRMLNMQSCRCKFSNELYIIKRLFYEWFWRHDAKCKLDGRSSMRFCRHSTIYGLLTHEERQRVSTSGT